MPQLSGAVHSIWWLEFSFYLFSHSGLRAFFTDDFANCTTVYAQPSGAVHSIWWLGLFVFDLFSHSGLRAFFTSDFANCTTDYAQTIRCFSQHLMVGVFFLPVFPFWTEGIFHRWFCQLYYNLCPTIRCCSQHLMVGVIFFDLFSRSGLRAFCTNDFANCTTNYATAQK